MDINKGTKSKIFISIPWFLPAYKAGGPVRSVNNMILALKEDYEFYVFTGNTDVDGTGLSGIVENTWISLYPHANVFFCSQNNRSDLLTKNVALVQPDLIFLIGIFSWHFNILPVFYCRKYPKLLSVRGMLHTQALQQKALKKNLFISLLKLLGFARGLSFHATDHLEATFIKEVFGKSATVYVANNIPEAKFSIPVLSKTIDSLVLVSVCLISPMKNILLVLQALKLVKCSVTYNIYGAVRDVAYWEQCKQAIMQLPKNILVHYHGTVPPAEVHNKLKSAHVYIQPSESENYGHSLVEALSYGLPVITSYNTPWQNLSQHKAGINVELNMASVAAAVDFFGATNHEQLRIWQEMAQAFIKDKIDIRLISQQYKHMFNEVASA